VPDEDLYEQGVFPSTFKWTFTIGKAQSWCPKSINLIELLGHFVPEQDLPWYARAATAGGPGRVRPIVTPSVELQLFPQHCKSIEAVYYNRNFFGINTHHSERPSLYIELESQFASLIGAIVAPKTSPLCLFLWSDGPFAQQNTHLVNGTRRPRDFFVV